MIVSECLNVVNGGKHLRELRNLETMHFRTYVDINYFYYLHLCFIRQVVNRVGMIL
jgi:hypothetical protein